MSVKYILNGNEYSKTAALGRMRSVIKELWKGKRVSVFGTKHERFIVDCFCNHPSYKEKTYGGKPIEDIFIDRANSKHQEYNVKVEGKYAPQNFGMPKCFMNSQKRGKQHFDLAMRSEINDVIYSIRCSMAAEMPCDYCSKVFDKEELAVDHDVTQGQAFLDIKESFLKTNPNANYNSIEKEENGMHQRFLIDRKLAKRWADFHHKHAAYRFLCVTCNNQTINKPKKRKK